MRIRVRTFPALLIIALTLVLAAFPAMAGEEGHFDRTLNVTGLVDMTVQTGSGTITVRRGEPGKVEIHGTIRASDWPRGGDIEARIQDLEKNPPIEQSGNTIRIGHIEDRERQRHISISYDLVVPAETKLRAESGSGEQTIDGVRGPVDATSGSGELKFSNIGGEVHAQTGSGDIELNSVSGTTRARTGSGTIHANGIAGGLTASSGSGDVKLRQTSAGDVEISTGSGDVEIGGVKGGARITTGSGTIHAQGEPTGEWRLRTGSGEVTVELPPAAAFDLVARTSSGEINTQHEIAIQGTVSPRELHGKVHGGGVLVDLSTSSGTINIR